MNELPRYINIKDKAWAEPVLVLQRESYQIEADLIGFQEIPPLVESIEELLACEEFFIIIGSKDDVKGLIALEMNLPDSLTISRLCVSPKYFRQGIAGTLVRWVLSSYPDIKIVNVSTGAENIPAIRFYENMGFAPRAYEWVANQSLKILKLEYSRG
ncbi:MAG: GNAT family N-acetyltransferase [Bacteroidales bacterium]|nr:GNAT family N-acetyltransferase [Bacteroidales bacterium]